MNVFRVPIVTDYAPLKQIISKQQLLTSMKME